MADKLPAPATAADMYANAIVTELRALNRNISKLIGNLAEDVDAPADAVELKEPAKAKPSTRDEKQAADKKAAKKS